MRDRRQSRCSVVDTRTPPGPSKAACAVSNRRGELRIGHTSGADVLAKTRIIDLVRPHWKALTLALVAVLGETVTDILEPWPIKIVVDNILQSKKLPWLDGRGRHRLFGTNTYAILNFAVAAVALIAIVGAVSSYVEKYLTTSVSQWVAHDLRRTLYQHIQRLSLAEHDESRTGDLITRVTSDIDAVQDFINSALLGMLVNVLTLVGMIGVMFYLNWRFTLIALSVVAGARSWSCTTSRGGSRRPHERFARRKASCSPSSKKC